MQHFVGKSIIQVFIYILYNVYIQKHSCLSINGVNIWNNSKTEAVHCQFDSNYQCWHKKTTTDYNQPDNTRKYKYKQSIHIITYNRQRQHQSRTSIVLHFLNIGYIMIIIIFMYTMHTRCHITMNFILSDCQCLKNRL